MTFLSQQAMTEPFEITLAQPACPSCHSNAVSEFLSLANQPVNVGIVWDSYEEAVRAPKADIRLCGCLDCGFIFNREFDSKRVEFSARYEVDLMHSPTFREYLEEVTSRLIGRYQLNEKTIVEVGCGSASFLKYLCERGNCSGIGIDPSVPFEGEMPGTKQPIKLIRDYFGTQHEAIDCDLACSLSVLEDIPEPHSFLKSLHQLTMRNHAPVYVDVFNGFRALNEGECWSIHYEQCNYFSLETLVRLFRCAGFEIQHSGTCYQGDQYLYVEAIPGSKDQTIEPIAESQFASMKTFANDHKRKCDDWNQKFSEYATSDRRVVVWGTGGKGVSFLNTVDTQGVIKFVVESNQGKQGKYLGGSGQKIVSPEYLQTYRPDVIIVTNRIYLEEMRNQALSLGVEAEFLVA